MLYVNILIYAKILNELIFDSTLKLEGGGLFKLSGHICMEKSYISMEWDAVKTGRLQPPSRSFPPLMNSITILMSYDALSVIPDESNITITILVHMVIQVCCYHYYSYTRWCKKSLILKRGIGIESEKSRETS